MMKCSNLLGEVTSLLYWTMLAACTVGPGTVVTCARAGAEYGLNLTWALIFASVLSYTLTEGTARLTIVSGQSLGQCLRIKYRDTPSLYNTALVGWLVTGSIFIGNTLYECNCWAGGIDAVLAIPGAIELTGSAMTGLRVGCCFAYAVVVLVLLFLDKTDKLGVGLGLVMVGMVVLFLIVVVIMGMDWKKFGLGLLPNLPSKTAGSAEPTDMVLSLVGTTAIGFNLFLGGSMAKGKGIGEMQRGILFSTTAAFCVSVLILIVGSGMEDQESSESFTIIKLSQFIEELVGKAGVIVFAIGFIAAALSSMLTVPLGAALTADSIFSDETDEAKKSSAEDLIDAEGQKLPRSIYLGIICIIVFIATVLICADVDRLVVILIAQIFNGCLLPFLAICLLLCLNDPQFMSSSPQKGWANIFLVISVTITLFLASNVVVQKVFGTVIDQTYIKLLVSGGVALVGMVVLCLVTSLGRELVKSFKHCTSSTK